MLFPHGDDARTTQRVRLFKCKQTNISIDASLSSFMLNLKKRNNKRTSWFTISSKYDCCQGSTERTTNELLNKIMFSVSSPNLEVFVHAFMCAHDPFVSFTEMYSFLFFLLDVVFLNNNDVSFWISHLVAFQARKRS